MPARRVAIVVEDPGNADVPYLRTDYGVFGTIDQAKTWTPFSTSAPSVTIHGVRSETVTFFTLARGQV